MQYATLNTGDVIQTGVHGKPLIRHLALVLREGENIFLLHNPMWATRARMDSAADYFTSRYIVCSYGKMTAAPAAELIELFEQIKNRSYDLVFNNCEDFINNMIKARRFQAVKITFILSAVLLLIYILHYFNYL